MVNKDMTAIRIARDSERIALDMVVLLQVSPFGQLDLALLCTLVFHIASLNLTFKEHIIIAYFFILVK